MQIGVATVKSSMGYFKKLKMELLYDLGISLLGTYLKKPEILIQKNICTSMFIVVSFTIAKIWQPKCPSVDEWTKKLWYIYTVEYYSAIKKKNIFL